MEEASSGSPKSGEEILFGGGGINGGCVLGSEVIRGEGGVRGEQVSLNKFKGSKIKIG